MAVWTQVVLCLLALQMGPMPSLAEAQPPEAARLEAAEEVIISGSLAVGQFSYTISGKTVLAAGKVESFELLIRSGQSQVAAARTQPKIKGGTLLEYGGETRRLSTDCSPSLARLLSLTSRDLHGSMMVARLPGQDTRTWESTSPFSVRPGLPVKVRFVFCKEPLGQDGGGNHLVEVTVWSLSEWNNSFDENVVLRLRFSRGGCHD